MSFVVDFGAWGNNVISIDRLKLCVPDLERPSVAAKLLIKGVHHVLLRRCPNFWSTSHLRWNILGLPLWLLIEGACHKLFWFLPRSSNVSGYAVWSLLRPCYVAFNLVRRRALLTSSITTFFDTFYM